jgi:hypothetical protein
MKSARVSSASTAGLVSGVRSSEQPTSRWRTKSAECFFQGEPSWLPFFVVGSGHKHGKGEMAMYYKMAPRKGYEVEVLKDFAKWVDKGQAEVRDETGKPLSKADIEKLIKQLEAKPH